MQPFTSPEAQDAPSPLAGRAGDPEHPRRDGSHLALLRLDEDVEAQQRRVRTTHPDWPCGKGCDGCCRRLAEVPRVSAAEWARLWEGLATLSAALREELIRGIAALSGEVSGPIVCPLLDPLTGACRVYPYRPVACRTYGYYVQQGLGLYCKDIETRVAAGEWSEVVWGNHDAIDRRLAGLGESRDLSQWLAAEHVQARGSPKTTMTV